MIKPFLAYFSVFLSQITAAVWLYASTTTVIADAELAARIRPEGQSLVGYRDSRFVEIDAKGRVIDREKTARRRDRFNYIAAAISVIAAGCSLVAYLLPDTHKC